ACVRHMTGGAGQGSAGVSRWNGNGGGTVRREVRTFKTMTTDLLALSEWLASEGCTHVVMEASGP
ncbi:MAG: hypothetical protein ACREFV_05425, partial [Acetobacteraceae bacterium]